MMVHRGRGIKESNKEGEKERGEGRREGDEM